MGGPSSARSQFIGSRVVATMNAGGWTFLLVSWALILGLVVFCLVRVLGGKESGENSEGKDDGCLSTGGR